MSWLLMHHGKNLILTVFWAFLAWSFYYAGVRWNANDEEWFHRHGECRHTHEFCSPPGPKTW
jgi:hypothetical protein